MNDSKLANINDKRALLLLMYVTLGKSLYTFELQFSPSLKDTVILAKLLEC